MEYATIVVMLALLQYFWFTMRTGARRGKLGIEAPATSGNQDFERAFRVQQNTLEQLIIFVPATYAFAHFVSAGWVLLPGAVFIVGRFMYSSSYLKEPARRGPGMGATIIANVALIVAVLIKVVPALF
jgi:uncharacterized membrane protein YecN with MAPEG domain